MCATNRAAEPESHRARTAAMLFADGSSGGVGSLNLAADPSSPWREANFPVYASSKAALNMLAIKYAAAFPRMRINSVDPGFTSTDFNQHRGTQTVEEGAQVIVRYALIAVDGPTGGFFERDGAEPW
jgi:NAD(P)-dependent dehydrogenase (short-subunit alcohol dehydrogenase family)